MPIIRLETHINAPKKIVFDLSRSVELHKISNAHTNETVVAGRKSGLFQENDTVTWRAKHLGIYQQLTSKMTLMQPYDQFENQMLKGAFKGFKHQHFFEETASGTLMKDVFDFEAPLGVLGKLANWLFLEKYMRDLLLRRNKTIKEFAESGRYKEILSVY
ncbi:MAG: SRPBCC family protein [Saprospiraceae bacterium]|nr:SRPBCC family protein [Saprospiraceae bacterium]